LELETQVKILSIVLLLAFTSQAFGGANEFHPVKLSCAAFDQKAKPFVFVDFGTDDSQGVMSPEELFKKEYSAADYPFKNFRLINIPGHVFRIAADAHEHVYLRGQFMTVLSIYEEAGTQLVQRSLSIVHMDGLMGGYRMEYALPGGPQKVSCLVHSQVKKKARVPAANAGRGKAGKKN
jgi:hypothetical protein